MSDGLADRRCLPCSGQVLRLTPAAIAPLAAQLAGWEIVAAHHLTKSWRFRDFKSALAWTNAIGALAETEGHHPDLLVAWGRVEATIFTHAIDGLTEADFILAAKIDRLASEAQGAR